MNQDDVSDGFESAIPGPAPHVSESDGRMARYRLDGPHLPLSGSSSENIRQTAPDRAAPRRDTHLLLEATQMLQRLQEEMSEQDRREADLAAAEERLASERQSFDDWTAQVRSEIAAQRAEIAKTESYIAERLSVLESQLQSLNSERETLNVEQQQIARARLELEQELQSKIERERTELLELRQSVADQFTQLELARSQLSDNQAAAAAEQAKQLQQEREQLWAALTAEWQQKRQEFEAERQAWITQRKLQDDELKQLRDRYDQALLGLETQITNRRASAAAELQQLRDACELEIQELRTAWKEEQSRSQADEQRDRVLWETRLRFQSEHLEKVRSELEAAQAEFKLERQQARQALEDDARQLERLRSQTQLFRESIEAQAQSLDRDRDALLKCRNAWDSSVNSDRAALQAEREAWEQEHRRQHIELQRQRDVLASHSESLERKRQRLESLRSELEETHRATLELRLAVEEAWAQIADALGSDDEARLRVDQARQALVMYYQELHATLSAQREDLLEQQARFDHQRLSFHDERQTLMEWLTNRDEQLRTAEELLRQERLAMSQRDQDWQKEQNQWITEKLAAESLIRKLLGQLGATSPEEMANLAATDQSADQGVPAPHFLHRQNSAVSAADSQELTE